MPGSSSSLDGVSSSQQLSLVYTKLTYHSNHYLLQLCFPKLHAFRMDQHLCW